MKLEEVPATPPSKQCPCHVGLMPLNFRPLRLSLKTEDRLSSKNRPHLTSARITSPDRRKPPENTLLFTMRPLVIESCR